MAKNKIVVDLDVVVVSLIDSHDNRKEEAIKFVDRIKNKDFYVITFSDLLKLTEKWKNGLLVKQITDFYYSFTDRYLDSLHINEWLVKKGINFDTITKAFLKKDIKFEDILLILACSLVRGILITLNKRHLKNNEEVINRILEENGLPTISIKFPNEL